MYTKKHLYIENTIERCCTEAYNKKYKFINVLEIKHKKQKFCIFTKFRKIYCEKSAQYKM